MTGKSLLWKVEGEERKRMLSYYKKLGSGLFIVGGAFLLLEHLFKFEGFDIEFLGHEYIGLVLIGLGFLLKVKWKQLPAFLNAIKNRQWMKVLDKGKR